MSLSSIGGKRRLGVETHPRPGLFPAGAKNPPASPARERNRSSPRYPGPKPREGKGRGASQKHPPIPRHRLHQMLCDNADAPEAARVFVRNEPIGARGAALGQDPDEVLEA